MTDEVSFTGGRVGAILLYGKTATGELVPVLVDDSGAIVTAPPA